MLNPKKKNYIILAEKTKKTVSLKNIEEKKVIKHMSPQLQNNNKKNQRMEFRRKEFEQINKIPKIFLEKIDELKSSVESLRKDNRLLEIKVFNLQKWREDDHKTICALKKNERMIIKQLGI